MQHFLFGIFNFLLSIFSFAFFFVCFFYSLHFGFVVVVVCCYFFLVFSLLKNGDVSAPGTMLSSFSSRLAFILLCLSFACVCVFVCGCVGHAHQTSRLPHLLLPAALDAVSFNLHFKRFLLHTLHLFRGRVQ